MCYLAAYPAGVMPVEEELENGVRLNPHGFGWSLGDDEVYRGLNAAAAMDAFLWGRRCGSADSDAIFHARYSTGTPHTLANCQPLALNDGTILAHNGALFPVSGDDSDTREFAEEYLPRWNLDSKADREELCSALGRNKMVIKRPGRPLLILNAGYGIWHADGSWHSNADYTGKSHLAADTCGACGYHVPGLPPASMCETCKGLYLQRRELLGRW